MAEIHNQLKQATEISIGLRRMFGGDSGLSVERLSETLQPIVNIWEHPYCAWLRGETLWSCDPSQGAVAGEFSAVAIVNPAGSGELITVEGGSIRSGTAGTAFVGINTQAALEATLATAVTVVAADTRARLGRVRCWQGTDAAQANILTTRSESVTIPTTSCVPLETPPYILSPGFGLVVMKTVVNETLTVSFFGVERLAVPGELV